MVRVESTGKTHALTRSLDDRVAAGVCGGLAVYLDTDPVWLRLGFVGASLFWGVGLLVYAVLWITLPEQAEEDGEAERPPLATSNPRAVIGILLVTLGLLALLWNVLSHVSVKFMLPVILVALGLFLLFHRRS
jgi:phage shock protein PspC (stress-responsive transcriptional regulator)